MIQFPDLLIYYISSQYYKFTEENISLCAKLQDAIHKQEGVNLHCSFMKPKYEDPLGTGKLYRFSAKFEKNKLSKVISDSIPD